MFRRRIVGAIIKRVSEIQNAGLAEERIKELNDQINNIIRSKARWESRILELGGPDYRKERSQYESVGGDGDGLGAHETGYMYFGAAKGMKGVDQ